MTKKGAFKQCAAFLCFRNLEMIMILQVDHVYDEGSWQLLVTCKPFHDRLYHRLMQKDLIGQFITVQNDGWNINQESM